MECRERVAAAVSHRQPDRTPVFLARIDDLDYWLESYGVEDEEAMRAMFGLDIRKVKYNGLFDVEEGKTIWGTKDLWDAGYSMERGGFPLAGARSVADVENHRWPQPEVVDYKELQARVNRMDPRYTRILSLGFQPVFCTLCDLFGMEEAMVLMHENPAMIEAAVAGIERFLLAEIGRALKHCAKDVDFFWYGDDFSAQRGMMLSPELWRRFLGPVYGKVFDLIKSCGVGVWFHSCGTFRPVLSELIDAGMDVWETVQVHLEGNDPHELKREYGKHITFFGAINCQQTLPFGTPEDVRKEVRHRIRVLGKGGGYICGPDHSIQKNMPAENLLALYDEARKCCS